ncbi:MAG: vitamin K epoxide reductase family protein [Phycisphaeraceae bacterium]
MSPHSNHPHGQMGQRGVTRPMAMHQQHGHDNSGGEHDHGHGGMSHDDRLAMLHKHHRQTLWIYWTLIVLGAWMLVWPATFDHGQDPVDPSGGRSVWLSLEARIWAMNISDIVAGLLLIVLGWRSLRPNRPVSLWGCCFVGIWLTAAPLIFWAPTAAAYVNNTLVGAWVIALSILIPGMPNMIMYMRMGPATPPGWSYNPSSWPQRWILILLGFVGWLVSRYLAAYQLGYIDHAADPFFGEQTRMVLDSNMSHMWPISDAGLGSLAYTFEFLMGYMGSPSRWRTMPWMVAFFGVLVIPLGLTHILLVISQPVVVGAWCTFCLLAAAIMLPMIPLEVDEVVAMGQNLRQSHHKGEPLWRVFWKGGTVDGSTPDERSPELAELPERFRAVSGASLWGVSVPWTLAAATALGVWLMFGPAIFGSDGMPRHAQHVGGALMITVAVIAMGEPLRLSRYLNVLLALAVIVGVWGLAGATLAAQLNATATALLVAGLSLPRGRVNERFGGWDRFVR